MESVIQPSNKLGQVVTSDSEVVEVGRLFLWKWAALPLEVGRNITPSENEAAFQESLVE